MYGEKTKYAQKEVKTIKQLNAYSKKENAGIRNIVWMIDTERHF